VRELHDALADYEQRRNEAVMPVYEFTAQLAALEPPSAEMEALFAALRDDEEEASRFLGTVAGTVPLREFFSPENLGRIVSSRTIGLASAT
jgi:hypothetical protein